MLVGGDLTVAGDDTHVEHVGVTLVLETAQALHPLDLSGAQSGAGHGDLHGVDEGAALQHAGVGVAQGLQAVLQEVAALTLGAHQQQLVVQVGALDGAVDGGQVHPSGAGQSGGGVSVQHAVLLGSASGVLGGSEGLEGAGHLVLQDVAGLDKGMDGGGEGRRIGVVQGVEVGNLGAHGNAGDGDVHHLVHSATAQHLDTQQLAGGLVGDELGDKRGGVGIVVSLVVGDAGHSDHVIALSLGLSLGQAGAASIEVVGQTDHAGAHAAQVGGVGAGEVLGKAPAGDVGGGAHGGPLALAGDAVVHHGAVAHGVHIIEVGALVVVHHDGALHHLQAGLSQETGGGTDADGQHHHVGGQHAGAGIHASGLLGAHNALEGGASAHTHALSLELAADVVGHLSVKDVGHQLVGHVHHSDVQALGHEVLGDLQADEAAAHHHGVAAVVVVHVSTQTDGVVGGTHGIHTLPVHALHGGHKGLSAHGHHQLVIADGVGLTAGHVAHGHGLGVGVHGGGLHTGDHVHAGQALVLCGGVDDQLVPGLNAAAHIVGQAAPGIGNVLALGVDGDVGVPVLTLELGGGLGACGNAADDDHVHISLSFVHFFAELSVLIIPYLR